MSRRAASRITTIAQALPEDHWGLESRPPFLSSSFLPTAFRLPICLPLPIVSLSMGSPPKRLPSGRACRLRQSLAGGRSVGRAAASPLCCISLTLYPTGSFASGTVSPTSGRLSWLTTGKVSPLGNSKDDKLFFEKTNKKRTSLGFEHFSCWPD